MSLAKRFGHPRVLVLSWEEERTEKELVVREGVAVVVEAARQERRPGLVFQGLTRGHSSPLQTEDAQGEEYYQTAAVQAYCVNLDR